ncbi:MAG: hypothetical protein C0392_01760 [Syntrophus sp. (in: bacteria)]|nr:hypothetical protein [Syntrophus sp. (in: bacteria)]
MSDTFDTNLLSQVKALDRKLSISKEFMSPGKKHKQGEHKKGNYFMMKQPQEGVHEEKANSDSIEISKNKIDIII